MLSLSIVVPCYNEQERLEQGFKHLIGYLEKQKYLWDVIFVNDGSSDNTKKILEKIAGSNKNIKVISYAENKGKGYAIKKGMLSANGDIVLFSDIDFSVPIDTVEKFLKVFNSGAKAVIGSRRISGSKLVKRQNILRETLGRGFTLLVKLLIDKNVNDATCGFKAFTRETSKKVFEKVSIYDWAFDAEIIYILKKEKIDYVQYPVEWTDAKGTKVNIFKDGIKSLFGLIKVRLNGILSKYN